MTPDVGLRYQLHISNPIPFSRPETAPNGERQMFQYIATALIRERGTLSWSIRR